jgi:hypothetical protein
MKTIAPILLFVCISSFSLYGQTDGPSKPFHNQKSDSIFIKPCFKNPNKNFDLYRDRILKPNSDLSQKRFHFESPEIKNSYDKLFAERFPGSEIFYAKRPYLIYSYEKSFVKKPDTTAKYYLIIKDPITHRRIN